MSVECQSVNMHSDVLCCVLCCVWNVSVNMHRCCVVDWEKDLCCVSNVLLCVDVMCCVVFHSCACLSVIMYSFMIMIWYECGM